jgi:hypothetical protein
LELERWPGKDGQNEKKKGGKEHWMKMTDDEGQLPPHFCLKSSSNEKFSHRQMNKKSIRSDSEDDDDESPSKYFYEECS